MQFSVYLRLCNNIVLITKKFTVQRSVTTSSVTINVMALFHIKWLRRFMRKNTNQLSYHDASKWKQRLSLAYAFLAWNAFGFMMYAVYQGKSDWAKDKGLKSPEELALTPAQSFARQFKMDKAKVIRLNGVNQYLEYEIDNAETNGTDESEMK